MSDQEGNVVLNYDEIVNHFSEDFVKKLESLKEKLAVLPTMRDHFVLYLMNDGSNKNMENILYNPSEDLVFIESEELNSLYTIFSKFMFAFTQQTDKVIILAPTELLRYLPLNKPEKLNKFIDDLEASVRDKYKKDCEDECIKEELSIEEIFSEEVSEETTEEAPQKNTSEETESEAYEETKFE
jgi:hypothetical protein